MAEAALLGYKIESWTGLMAPGGTPKPVIDRLHQEIVRTLADPAVLKRLSETGFQPRSSTHEAYVHQIRDDLDQWAGVVKATGATADQRGPGADTPAPRSACPGKDSLHIGSVVLPK